MEQERPPTAEKQLLKIIEDPKAQSFHQKEVKHKTRSLFSFSALRGRFSFLKEKVKTTSGVQKPALDIRGINRLLKLCIVLLVFYLGFSFMMAKTDQERSSYLDVDIPLPKADEDARKVSVFNEVSYYLEKPRARDIFQFGTIASKEEVLDESITPPDLEVTPAVEEMIKDFGLVGISWSEDPDAMVEDLDTQEVYFLKQGDWIEGKIKVERILRDRVILSYEGEEAELE